MSVGSENWALPRFDVLPCAFRSSASLTGGPLILGAAAASFLACATFAASRRFRSAASLASFFA